VPARRRVRVPCPPRSAFAGFRFPPEMIVLAVRWHLRFGLSYRDVEELLAERGVQVDHVSVYRWVRRFAPLLADPDTDTGTYRPLSRNEKDANTAHARLRGPGERANAELKNWKILRKLRTSPTQATTLVNAVQTLILATRNQTGKSSLRTFPADRVGRSTRRGVETHGDRREQPRAAVLDHRGGPGQRGQLTEEEAPAEEEAPVRPVSVQPGTSRRASRALRLRRSGCPG
jgi:hypothetical protein